MGTRLTDPGGSTVVVDDERVEHLLTVGYTRESGGKAARSESSSSGSDDSGSSGRKSRTDK